VAKSALTNEQVLTLLAETPSRLAALTAGATPAQLHTPPRPGEWSVNDILAHLRSCSDVWGGCIATLLAEDKPTIRAVNPTTWINSTDYPKQKFQPSLRAFTQQRAELLAVLQPLPPKAWARSATVTGAAGRSSVRCGSMPSGWGTMNIRTSNTSPASSPRCAGSHGHP